jgi:hypothetical protein
VLATITGIAARQTETTRILILILFKNLMRIPLNDMRHSDAYPHQNIDDGT